MSLSIENILENSTWTNELGSNLKIETAKDGIIIGKYQSSVGKVDGSYKLVGTYETNDSKKISLALSVSWTNEKKHSFSSTAWCGFINLNDMEISTTWILTKSNKDKWKSTLIGQNMFKLTNHIKL